MKKEKLNIIRPALVCILILSLICGVIYPLIVTGISQLAFNDKANGSIISVTLKNGETVDIGSEYIAQNFTKYKEINHIK